MMKKAGEILKEARLGKSLSIDDVHDGTKIRPSYIEAIENSNYNIFHSLMTIKGFLRNYAIFLDLNPESVIAIYRREQSIKSETKPKLFKVQLPKWNVSSTLFVVIAAILIVVAVFAFFTFQYIEVSSPPQFDIIEPADKSTTTQDKTLVKVVAQKEGIDVFINKSKISSLDENGNYFTTINLVEGQNKIEVKAVNGFKKETVKEIVINRKIEIVPSVTPSQSVTAPVTTTPKSQDLNVSLKNTSNKPVNLTYTLDTGKATSITLTAGQSIPLVAKQKLLLTGPANMNNLLEVFVNNAKLSLLTNTEKQLISGINPTKVTASP